MGLRIFSVVGLAVLAVLLFFGLFHIERAHLGGHVVAGEWIRSWHDRPVDHNRISTLGGVVKTVGIFGMVLCVLFSVLNLIELIKNWLGIPPKGKSE